jgi:hypothetical protein
MAFDGSGTFSRIYNWVTDRINGVPITDTRMDGEMDGMATGLTNCITKDGQSTTLAAIPFALGVKLGNGAAATPTLNFISDTSTGFFHKSAGVIGVSASGVEIGSISAADGFVALNRKVLTGDIIIYFRTDGTNSGDGSVDSVGSAFSTAQLAYNYMCDHYDLNGHKVTLKCSNAASVHTVGITTSRAPKGVGGAATVVLDCTGGRIRTNLGPCIDFGTDTGWGSYPVMTIANVRLETTSSGNCINVRAGIVVIEPGTVFGGCAGTHKYCGHMGQIICTSSYSIDGNAVGAHDFGYSGGLIITESATVTISSVITVGDAFLHLTEAAMALLAGTTYVNSGNVGGTKFAIDSSGTMVNVGGAGLSALPGNVAGTIAGGASYDSSLDTGMVSYSASVTQTGGTIACIFGYKIDGSTVFYTGRLTATVMTTISTPLKRRIAKRWNDAKITRGGFGSIAKHLVAAKDRYQAVSAKPACRGRLSR